MNLNCTFISIACNSTTWVLTDYSQNKQTFYKISTLSYSKKLLNKSVLLSWASIVLFIDK